MFQQDQTTIKNQVLTWSRDLTIGREIYGDEEINAGLLADPTKEGIWYHTGHAFYYD